jgi:hypothetical protein
MNSINGYEFYIVIRKDGKYLISACEFSIIHPSQNTKDYIFQILKDTHFNCIEDETGDLYYEIIAIKHSGSNQIKKQLILDYYEGKNIDFIKPILKFNCNKIQDSIKITNHNGFEEQNLTINNTHRTEYLKHIKDNYSDQTIEFYNYLKNIELSFIVNDYDGKKYISNPSFTINKNYLNYLL